MSSFVLKLIAIISMFLDHSSDALIGHLSVLNIIGRLAFPIFAFQLAIGYTHTHDISKYAKRLALFAFISQIPLSIFTYFIFGTAIYLNIFFTLLFGLISLLIYDKVQSKPIKYIAIIILTLIAEYLHFDYGAWGVLLILYIYLFCPIFKSKNNAGLFLVGFLALCILKYIPNFSITPLNWLIAEILFTFLPSVLMLLYNGKKGPSLKYISYIFYPLHITVLDIIFYIIH